jgi:RNA polymerase sigma factor (sigma-70 family)
MTEHPAKPPDIDAELLPFFSAATPQDALRALEKLVVETIAPVVRKILKRKLRFYESGINAAEQNYEDLENDVLVLFIRRLREIKSASDDIAIPDVRGYAAAIAYNACYEYTRRKFPERARLKNKIRYSLNQRQDLDLWKTPENLWLGGLSKWERLQPFKNADVNRLIENPFHERLAKYWGKNQDEAYLPELLKDVIELIAAPVEIDDLVSIAVNLLKIEETESESYDADGSLLRATLPSTDRRQDEIFEQRTVLERLWREIKELPVRQRAALLLNLTDKDGRDIISLLPFMRIAAINQIAEVLEIPPDRFIELWKGLPLEDAAIAELLGITRQQVINLRKSARARLRRRVSNAA